MYVSSIKILFWFRFNIQLELVRLIPDPQSIISTPYPLGLQKDEYRSSRLYQNGKDLLTLVIYSSQASNRLAKVKQITIPTSKDIVVVDDSDPTKPQVRATIRCASLPTLPPFLTRRRVCLLDNRGRLQLETLTLLTGKNSTTWPL